MNRVYPPVGSFLLEVGGEQTTCMLYITAPAQVVPATVHGILPLTGYYTL